MAGNAMEGKLQPKIDELVKKHYTEDRKWRYNLETTNFRSL